MARLFGWFYKGSAATINPVSVMQNVNYGMEFTVQMPDTLRDVLSSSTESAWVNIGRASQNLRFFDSDSGLVSNPYAPMTIGRVTGVVVTGSTGSVDRIRMDLDDGGGQGKELTGGFPFESQVFDRLFGIAPFANLILRSDSSTEYAHWDCNQVLNAAGDGWVSRSDALDDPSIAEAGFESKIYDITSFTGNHAQGEDDFVFIGEISATGDAVSGNSLSFTSTSGLNPGTMSIGGLSSAFTFNTDGGSFYVPDIGDVAGFPKFGTRTFRADRNDGGYAQTNVNFQPASGRAYVPVKDNTVTGENILWNDWDVKPVIGDQIEYDPAILYIQGDGLTEVVTTDETWQTTLHVIDSTGSKSFEADDGGAYQLPSVSITTSPQTVTVGDNITLSADVTDADSVLWSANLGGTFENSAQSSTTFTPSESGSLELTLTGTNAEGSASDSVLMTVEDPQVIPTATITSAPTTANTGEQYNIEATVTDADSVLWTCTSGQSPTFGDPSAASTTFVLNEDGEHTIEITATSSTGDTASDSFTVTSSTVVVESVLNLTVAGIGTGSRGVVLHDRNTREVVFDGSMTFNDDVGSITLTGVEVGTEIYGAYFGINPPDTGTGLFGVGETE